MIGKVIKKSFILAYEYLGLVVLSSVIWFIFVIIPPLAGLLVNSFGLILVSGLISLILSGPLAASISYMASKIITRESPGILDIFEGLKKFWLRGLNLAIINFIVILVLLFNLYFWGASAIKLSEKPVHASNCAVTATPQVVRIPLIPTAPVPTPIAFAICIAMLYVLIYWGMMTIYQYPLIVQLNQSVWNSIKNSFTLVLGNLLFTAVIFFVIILMIFFVVLLFFSGVKLLTGFSWLLLFFIIGGLPPIIQNYAARELLKKYGVIEEEYPEEEEEE